MDTRHFIQRHILDTLLHQKFARFRDMRPARVDSNAYSYHLSALVRQGLIVKTSGGYTLTPAGLAYVDHLSGVDGRPRRQPKVMTITALFNEYDEVIVLPLARQPFIGQLTLPCGKLHFGERLHAAAQREVAEKVGLTAANIRHAGNLYFTASDDANVVMHTLFHVFIGEAVTGVALPDGAVWRALDEVHTVAPATRRIFTLLEHHRYASWFFDEYDERLLVEQAADNITA